MSHQRLVKVTRDGNRIGNRDEGQAIIIIHARGVWISEDGDGDIIHAEGVLGCFSSSTPKACGTAVGLACLSEAFDLVAQMLEIVRTDA